MSTPETILKLSNIESYYGRSWPSAALAWRCRVARSSRCWAPTARARPPCSRRSPAFSIRRRAPSSSRGGRSSAWRRTRSCASASAMCPRAARYFRFWSVRENLMMGAYPRKDRDGVADDLEPGLRIFPAPARAHQSAGGATLRRRTADAGDWPRADEPPGTAASGRAFARVVADSGEGDFHDHQARQRRAGHVDPAGRAERQGGAGKPRITDTSSRSGAW